MFFLHIWLKCIGVFNNQVVHVRDTHVQICTVK